MSTLWVTTSRVISQQMWRRFQPTKLEAALDRVWHAGTDLVEAQDADEALAAADIVARLRGKFGLCNSCAEGIDKWARGVRLSPSDDRVNKARRAVDRRKSEPSELLDLGSESDEVDAWQDSVEGLRRRLSQQKGGQLGRPPAVLRSS